MLREAVLAHPARNFTQNNMRWKIISDQVNSYQNGIRRGKKDCRARHRILKGIKGLTGSPGKGGAADPVAPAAPSGEAAAKKAAKKAAKEEKGGQHGVLAGGVGGAEGAVGQVPRSGRGDGEEDQRPEPVRADQNGDDEASPGVHEGQGATKGKG